MIVSALLLGVAVGMRSMTGPAALAWAAHLGKLKLGASFLACLGSEIALWICSALSIGELIVDKLPFVPSRKEAASFLVRLSIGALVGYAVGLANAETVECVSAGLCGAVIGTVYGYALRNKLASTFKRDIPAALLEDSMAIGLVYYAINLLP